MPGTIAHTNATYWMDLPYELKSEIVRHHIDNLLDNLRPSYWYEDIESVTPSAQFIWLFHHPFYQELSRLKVLLGDMSSEIERLCQLKLSSDSFARCSETADARLSEAQSSLHFSAFSLLYTATLVPGGSTADDIVAEGLAVLEGVEAQRALQQRYEQRLLLQEYKACGQFVPSCPLKLFNHEEAAEHNSGVLESIKDDVWELLEEQGLRRPRG